MKLEKVVRDIKEMMERSRADIATIPKSVNPQNVPECVDIMLKFLNSIIRAKMVAKICEIAEGFDLATRDRLQIDYYKEVIKEHMIALYRSASRILDITTTYYTQDSFEYAIFEELRKSIREHAKDVLPSEIIGETRAREGGEKEKQKII